MIEDASLLGVMVVAGMVAASVVDGWVQTRRERRWQPDEWRVFVAPVEHVAVVPRRPAPFDWQREGL